MTTTNRTTRPSIGVKPGGRYAGGLIPIHPGDYSQRANPDDVDGAGPSLAQSIAASNAIIQANGGDRFARNAPNPLAAGAAVPDPRMVGTVSTIGAGGYQKMLANMQNGTFGNQPPANPGQQKPVGTGNPLVAAAAQTPAPQANQGQSSAPANPLVAYAKPTTAAPEQSVFDRNYQIYAINNASLQTPEPTTQQSTVQSAQPTQQPQKFARGRVPNALIDGIVRGEGGPTEDKVPAKVSPKEAILPAKTVQAMGGPAAIRALIERTNDGKQPESEVGEGGKYADGAVPGFLADWQDAMERGAPIKQDIASLAKLASDAAGYASSPVDAFMGKVTQSAQQIAGAARQAAGDFGGKSRLMPDVPPEDAAAYAAQRSLAGAAKQVESPATRSTTSPLVAAARSSTARPTPVPANPLVAGALYFNTPDAPPASSGSQPQSVSGTEREPGGPKIGIIEDGSKQDRRAFDNFVTRSNAESAYRDAVRSGRPQNIQVASNSLAALTQVGDNQEMKAGEFQRGMEALRAKGAQDQETDNNRAKNALAQYALQGRNALMGEAMRGSNAIDLENLRGANQRYVNPLAADAMRIRNQLDATKLADATSLQTMQTRMLAETDPAKRQEMVDQILAIQGREPSNRYSTNVVHGTKIKDSQGNETTTNPLSVTTDLRTGQTTSQRLGGESGQYLPLPADKAKMVTGQTYQTARGPARWDGKQFVGL